MIDPVADIALEPHRQIVRELVDEARAHPAVVGALLIGSLGRGNALPGSDIDLLLLLADGRGTERIFQNHERRGVLIEFHFRDNAAALAQLAEAPTWHYAYLDSRILYDTDNRLAQLVEQAGAGYTAHRTTPERRRRHAFYADRTRHKLQAAIDADDELRAGGVASTYASVVIDCLWTAYDRPSLGVSEMWVRLPDLIGLPELVAEQLRVLFLADALGRARAGIAICDHAVERLGGPVSDPYATE